MASQPLSGTLGLGDLQCLEIHSFARGTMLDSWTPVVGQVLLVMKEPTNPKDRNVVALYQDDAVVGHVPHSLAPYLTRFLTRDVNKAFAEVTGGKINRGAGYGPCVYRLYGPKCYVDEITDSMMSSGLL